MPSKDFSASPVIWRAREGDTVEPTLDLDDLSRSVEYQCYGISFLRRRSMFVVLVGVLGRTRRWRTKMSRFSEKSGNLLD